MRALRALIAIAGAFTLVGAAPPATPTDASKAKLDEARALLGAGRSSDAIALLREAVTLDRKNAAAHNALGSLLNRTGHYADALPHAEAAVALDPANARYRYNRGVVLAEHGRFAEAIADFDIALAAHPDLTYAWLERGAAKYSLGDSRGAQADWDRAGEVDPKLIWVRWYKATSDFMGGRYADAQAAFDAVARDQPEFDAARIWRFVASGRAGSPVAVEPGSGSDWPAPIAQYLAGAQTADALLKAVEEDRTTGDRRRVAEAHFFIAQQAIVAGRESVAIDQLRKALAIETPRHVWRIIAERDLKSLESR